uniref:Glycosyltransferase 61 catalytic domain-containing protein n=1 Tax=Mycena chlorophos TaxID=658473 RepID=A0ABQ0MBN5_MYCCL|nr:predicted protein [Mycena chlorophos]
MVLSRRDVVLALCGGSCFYLFTALVTDSRLATNPLVFTSDTTSKPHSQGTIDLGLLPDLPETTVVAHAPGWTIFKDLYMSKGALLLLTSTPEAFPTFPLMTSTGLPGNLTNDAERQPTEKDMAFLSPGEARSRWGGRLEQGERNRVLTLEGLTLLYNDPPQFLNHYFHFVAELIFGTWAFLYGAFADRHPPSATADASFTPPLISTSTPNIARAIYIHSDSDGWRDGPGFNGYAFRAVFPSTTVEVMTDWIDRVNATTNTLIERAWHFPLALLVDRSAAFRGPITGHYTQRTAAQAWMEMAKQGKIDLVGNWWASIRSALTRYAGGDPTEELGAELRMPASVVITYINRQGTRRHLREEDNLALLAAIQELVERKNREGGKLKWEFNDVHAERLSLDEQVRVASRTTIMLGVHGNGLTHLVLMKPNQLSAVVEIFLPQGFARDYEWTSRSLGMTHYSVWNDTIFAYPNEPPNPGYPEGFHGPMIPLYAPVVAKLIEDHVAARALGPSNPNNSPLNDFYAKDML